MLFYVIGFSLLGSVGAIAVSALLLLFPQGIRQGLVPCLISYATGTLLGAAFLGMIPSALSQAQAPNVLVERLDRYLCWRGASYLYTPWPSMNWDFYKAAASGAYPQLRLTAEERTEVGQLASKWQSRMKAAKGYMDIALECLILEEGVK